jgi:hypothetical protein
MSNFVSWSFIYLLAALLQRSTERTELRDGLRLRFTADAQILAQIARTVDAERLCCRFLSFTITVSPDGGPITLDLAGPAGTREFLAAIQQHFRRETGLAHYSTESRGSARPQNASEL